MEFCLGNDLAWICPQIVSSCSVIYLSFCESLAIETEQISLSHWFHVCCGFLDRQDSHLPCFLFYLNVLKMVKKWSKIYQKKWGKVS